MATAVVSISIEVSSALVLPPLLLPLYISSSHTSTPTSTATTATTASGGCNTDSIASSSPGMRHAATNFPHVDAQVPTVKSRPPSRCTTKIDDLFQSAV